jgi:hypothetical protein
VVAKLEKGEVSLLISLLTLESGKERGGDDSISNYGQRLIAMRDKLLTMLAEKKDLSRACDGDLPEFREYARRKHEKELDEDLITMFEDLVEMRRQGIR